MLPNLFEFAEGNPKGGTGSLDAGMCLGGLLDLNDLPAVERREIPVGISDLGLSGNIFSKNHELTFFVGIGVSPDSGGEEKKRKSENHPRAPEWKTGGKMAKTDEQKSENPRGGCEDEPLIGAEFQKAGAGKIRGAKAVPDIVHEHARVTIERGKEKRGVAGCAGAGGVVDGEVGEREVPIKHCVSGILLDEGLILGDGIRVAIRGVSRVGGFESGSTELGKEKQEEEGDL